jgi:short-subunit dehydrogenase
MEGRGRKTMAMLEDKVIVVTGASEGIGRALCLALATQRPKLAVAARNEDRLKELKEQLEPVGAKVLVVPTDVTEESACKNLIETTIREWGVLDVLVNNAGMSMWTTLEEMQDTSIIERLMRINYLGAAYCTFYALKYLKESRGRIVAISSLAGLGGIPTRTAYAASKHALFGFFDSLRIELMESGVSVTMIAPDFVLTELHRRAFSSDGNPLGKSPLQEEKIMTADECALRIVKAIEKRERLLVMSFRGKVGRWAKLIAPGLLDKVARRAIQLGK